MEKETKAYQLTCFISPLLNGEKLEGVIKNIKKWINDKGGSLSEEKIVSDEVERKRLAYPVKKHKEAFYLTLKFLLPHQVIDKLNQFLAQEKDILRYLIVNQPKLKPAPETLKYKEAKKIEPFLDKEFSIPEKPIRVEPLAKRKEEEKGKVKIEELEKKLEEILNE